MLPQAQKTTITRLKRARGQLDGIVRMVEEDAYCGDILTQLQAVEGALRGAMGTVLESHLTTCGEKALSSKHQKDREEFIAEIVRMLRRNR